MREKGSLNIVINELNDELYDCVLPLCMTGDLDKKRFLMVSARTGTFICESLNVSGGRE